MLHAEHLVRSWCLFAEAGSHCAVISPDGLSRFSAGLQAPAGRWWEAVRKAEESRVFGLLFQHSFVNLVNLLCTNDGLGGDSNHSKSLSLWHKRQAFKSPSMALPCKALRLHTLYLCQTGKVACWPFVCPTIEEAIREELSDDVALGVWWRRLRPL